MIKSRMQLNALIRNKAAGDGDKAQILLRIYMMEASPEMLDAWENYRKNNPYVEDLTWGDAIHSVKLLKDQID